MNKRLQDLDEELGDCDGCLNSLRRGNVCFFFYHLNDRVSFGFPVNMAGPHVVLNYEQFAKQARHFESIHRRATFLQRSLVNYLHKTYFYCSHCFAFYDHP